MFRFRFLWGLHTTHAYCLSKYLNLFAIWFIWFIWRKGFLPELEFEFGCNLKLYFSFRIYLDILAGIKTNLKGRRKYKVWWEVYKRSHLVLCWADSVSLHKLEMCTENQRGKSYSSKLCRLKSLWLNIKFNSPWIKLNHAEAVLDVLNTLLCSIDWMTSVFKWSQTMQL